MHLSEDAVLESFAREHLTLVHRFAALASAATVEQQARIQVEEPTLASNHESTVATVPDLARIERVYRSAYAQAIQALPDSLRAALERNQIKWYASPFLRCCYGVRHKGPHSETHECECVVI